MTVPGSLFVAMMLLAWSLPVAAQTGEGRVLVGRVVDADGGGAIPAAAVSLLRPSATGPEELEGGALDAEALRTRALATEATDGRGVYRFRDVEPGRYLIHVERLGYRSVVIGVTTSDASGRVSVALEVEPIALPAVEVTARGGAPVRTASGEEVSLGRLSLEDLRQRRHLTSDSRFVTPADLQEAATLGETDIFRALQRLPGVTTRDDFSAELWTRGASWGSTRVYLDDMPLFNPLHGFGVLSGMSPHGITAVGFHPGIRPAAFPEGAAAVVDLRSRSGLGSRALTGGADLSLASAQAWARAPALDERLGWALSARRSWADLAAEGASDDPEEQLPYHFTDVHARLDLELDGGWRAGVTGLRERDRVAGELPDLLHRTSADWGNGVLTASVSGPVGPVQIHQMAGVTGYELSVREIEGDPDLPFNAPAEPPAAHEVRYLTAQGEIAPRGGADDRWRAGWQLTSQTARYEGPSPWPYSQRPPELPTVASDERLLRASVWGRTRWRPADRLAVDGGLRVAAGTRTRSGSSEILPTLSARLHLSEEVSVSGGVGRYAQYAQSPAPAGPRLDGGLRAAHLWVLAGERDPYLEVDMATLGAEAWLGQGWLGSATAYARRTEGWLLPDPAGGPLVQRRAFLEGTGEARGVELSLRKLTGRVTGSVGYSLADADARAGGTDFPSPSDRTHAADATLMARLGPSVDVGLAYTYASGSPYTRVLPCTPEQCEGVVLDRPFGRRSPAYSSLDLSAEYLHAFDRWSLGVYLQGRNLLGHDNAITYESTRMVCPGGRGAFGGSCPDGGAPDALDRFSTGMPTLPLLGLRVRF